MSRMLAALKQLDAKGSLKSPVAGAASRTADVRESHADGDGGDAVTPSELPGRSSHCDRTTAPADQQSPTATHSQRSVRRPARQTTPWEQRVRADLAHAQRASQYHNLADNLLANWPSTGRRTVLWLGAGHETPMPFLLGCAGAMMAEKSAKPVLLLDGDPLERDLTESLSLSAESGMVESLQGQVAWRGLVVGTGMDSLDVLPSGRGTLSCSSSDPEGLAPLLDELAEQWHAVLVHGGTVASPLAEALARVCARTYLIVRLGQTDPDAAEAAVSRLRTAGGRLAGCIATNAPER